MIGYIKTLVKSVCRERGSIGDLINRSLTPIYNCVNVLVYPIKLLRGVVTGNQRGSYPRYYGFKSRPRYNLVYNVVCNQTTQGGVTDVISRLQTGAALNLIRGKNGN